MYLHSPRENLCVPAAFEHFTSFRLFILTFSLLFHLTDCCNPRLHQASARAVCGEGHCCSCLCLAGTHRLSPGKASGGKKPALCTAGWGHHGTETAGWQQAAQATRATHGICAPKRWCHCSPKHLLEICPSGDPHRFLADRVLHYLQKGNYQSQ